MKLQNFNVGKPGMGNHGFMAFSVYHKDENVWTSDFCEPYEWNTETQMRRDMLIHYISEDQKEKELFESWDCRDEIEFLDKYEQYIN